MLDLFQDFVYMLLKSDVPLFCSANEVLPFDLSFGPLLKAPSSVFLLILKHSRGLPFTL